MTVTTFSETLRARTWSDHDDSEGATFMRDLMRGAGSREDYIAMVAQHYFIYEALEQVAERLRSDPVAASFVTDTLTRLPAIEDDLAFLIGADWREQVAPLPTTVEYVTRIHEMADWCGGFVAHHYTRYLGDLSGGQMILRVMQKRFGFDTNGVSFYLFDEIADPAEFKNAYRAQLDAAGWDSDERERIIDEVVRAYRYNTDLFNDLAAEKLTRCGSMPRSGVVA